MPTYDYQCETCGHRFEVFQSMNDAKLTDCPQDNCEGHVKRLLGTGAGLIFKGGGFYQTDNRSDSYQKAAKQDKDGGKSADKADTSSSPKEKTDKASKGSAEKSSNSTTASSSSS